MQVFFSIADVGCALKDSVTAIGNFDGIHLGHKALIEKVCHLAQTRAKAVFTFSPHPRELLRKDVQHFSLSSNQQRIEKFRDYGLDVALIHHIDNKFLSLTPKQFIEEILVKTLGVKDVVVGSDFRFGAGAKGDVGLLRSSKYNDKFTTHIVGPVLCQGLRCSSTNIRRMLCAGEVSEAAIMLGHKFSLRSVVERGQGRGGSLGFSTANITPHDNFLLRRGVYATMVRLKDSPDRGEFLACTNVGVRPSVSDDNKLVVETHVFDQELSLYGKEIEVFFVERLRGEEKFSSIKSLQAQVQTDLQRVRQMYLLAPHRFQIAD